MRNIQKYNYVCNEKTPRDLQPAMRGAFTIHPLLLDVYCKQNTMYHPSASLYDGWFPMPPDMVSSTFLACACLAN